MIMTDQKDVMIAELSAVVAELLTKLDRLEVYVEELNTARREGQQRLKNQHVSIDIDNILNT